MKLKDECGLFGIYSRSSEIAEVLHLGLFALQHRGQEAAGFALSDGRELRCYKDLGLIQDVYAKGNVRLFKGQIGIAHTRYSTQGESARPENAQPFILRRAGRWLALAHNGNLSNATQLREELLSDGVYFNSTSDTESLLHLYARALGKSPAEKLNALAAKVLGAYSALLIDGDRLIAFRDPFGFRPLVLGRRNEDWIVTSETAALDMVGAECVREIEPGEVIIIDREGLHSQRFGPQRPRRHCVFELIYFARPDSRLFGHNVYEFRKACGDLLAQKETHEIDIVVPVPDSGLPAALGYSRRLNKPLEFGLIRSHYIGRSFIEPYQASRVHKVRMKLLPLREVLQDRCIALVDDSIVRGTTSRAIVHVLREFGAREVHLRIASPPIVAPCYFGIDMPTREELVASTRTIPEITRFMGADSVIYLTVEELQYCAKDSENFCTSCFTARYPEESLPSEHPALEYLLPK
ncbi:amidophosphoribosyltransferase [Candidatus Acetothermia bacterium]|jgi:amidophosphoribosyltransferase|nr:amidophosphoribosyltransferase [Candidatus Acetothermia bacterium]MCI2432004.1 amidophosphoribosyltransferase [Candidatus Acetothermia bacterium]MCI2436801.1 amidophosphoribosyltransferase [Candidatus Acetothermia bacterium]